MCIHVRLLYNNTEKEGFVKSNEGIQVKEEISEIGKSFRWRSDAAHCVRESGIKRNVHKIRHQRA